MVVSLVRRIPAAFLSLAVLVIVSAEAGLADGSYSDLRDLYGQPKVVSMERFGNKKRIAKRIDPRVGRVDGRRYYERDVVSGRSQIVALRRFGNGKRIAKLVDPMILASKGRVVVRRNPQGRGNWSGLKRFGNRRRIARLTGQRIR